MAVFLSAQQVGSGASVTVVLGGQTCSPTNQSEIAVDAVALLKTSNFNSKDHSAGGMFTDGIHGVQARYRREVSRNYVAIAFPKSQHFDLIRGSADAEEIVIGLNFPARSSLTNVANLPKGIQTSSIFTIDTEGRVIEHSMYSGVDAVKFADVIRAAVNGSGVGE